jgi:hypothetical protein
MERHLETLLVGASMALVCLFWVWLAMKVWRAGWRPLGLIAAPLIATRFKFYVDWLWFRWRTRKDPPNSN